MKWRRRVQTLCALCCCVLLASALGEAQPPQTPAYPGTQNADQFASWYGAPKYDALPPIFAISVQEAERFLGDEQAYIHKEWLTTTNPGVNADIRAIVDGYETALAPTLRLAPKLKGKRESTLNIDVVYYRTGEQWLSTMVLARVNDMDRQQPVTMQTHTYDLKTGARITLADLFGDNGRAWDLLAAGVRAQLTAIFPGEAHNPAAIDALCTQGALQKAEFTLSGMALTLHYLARDIVPGTPTLAHVSFFYPNLWPEMTDLGRAVTDNSRWKMVAITCDDGPKDTPSTLALNNFRRVGARVTYFIVGKQLERYGYVLQRQYDQNHQIATHTYHHWGGRTFKNDQGRLKELQLSADTMIPLIGVAPSLFRAPGGTYPAWVDTGIPMPILQWSLDTHDYTGKSPKRIFYSFRNNIRDGDIVLCHDTGKYLFEAIPLFGKWLTDNGYMMVTVDELAWYAGVQMHDNVVYFSFREGR